MFSFPTSRLICSRTLRRPYRLLRFSIETRASIIYAWRIGASLRVDSSDSRSRPQFHRARGRVLSPPQQGVQLRSSAGEPAQLQLTELSPLQQFPTQDALRSVLPR